MGVGHIKTLLEAELNWPSPMAQHIGILAAFHADRKGVIRTSQTELAMLAMVTAKTVSRALDSLCDAGIMARLGHGRYGIQYGFAQNQPAGREMPQPKGADEELERLRPMMRAARDRGMDVYIAYTSEGWPVLTGSERDRWLEMNPDFVVQRR